MKIIYEEKDLKIYQIPYFPLNSNMYLIIEYGKAVIIDPNNNFDIDFILLKNNIKELTVLLTHGDFDHINGIPFLLEKYKIKVICHKNCADRIKNKRNNRPLLVLKVLSDRYGRESELYINEKKLYTPFSYDADFTFNNEYLITLNDHVLRMIYTPGHTDDSCCIEYDSSIIFSGDTILMDNSIITKFKQSDKELFNQYVVPYVSNLSPKKMIFPGHGEAFFKKELIGYEEG